MVPWCFLPQLPHPIQPVTEKGQVEHHGQSDMISPRRYGRVLVCETHLGKELLPADPNGGHSVLVVGLPSPRSYCGESVAHIDGRRMISWSVVGNSETSPWENYN